MVGGVVQTKLFGAPPPPPPPSFFPPKTINLKSVRFDSAVITCVDSAVITCVGCQLNYCFRVGRRSKKYPKTNL